MTSASAAFDVVIVGAGIVGCSTAWFLAKKGLRVCVCDAGEPGHEQSSRAWGFVRQQGRHPAELPLAQAALDLWRELTDTYGPSATDYVQGGVLMPAETEQDEAMIGRACETALAQGLPSRLLSARELSRMVPELKGQWRAALFTEGDGHADPALGTATVQRAARDAGVIFKPNTTVTGFICEKGQVRGIRVGTEHIAADIVVVAAGIGSRRLLQLLDYTAPIQVIRSSVARTNAGTPFTKIAMWAPCVAYRPCPDGSFVLGNGYRGAGTDYDITLNSLNDLKYFLPAFRKNARHIKLTLGRDLYRSVADLMNGERRFEPFSEPAVNETKVAFNLSQLKTLFPMLDQLCIEKSWAGRLDITPDLIPVIDRLERFPNVFAACGFSGHGFAIGPPIGREISRWIVDDAPSIDLSSFKHTRFANGDYQHVSAF